MSLQKFVEATKTNKAIQDDLENGTTANILNVAKKHGFDVSENQLKDFKAQPPVMHPEECGRIIVNTWYCTGKPL